MPDSVGIRLGVDGEKAFKDSLAAVNSQLKSLGAEMLAVTASFTKNANSQEALAAKNTVLGKSMDMQKEKVGLLNKQIESQKGKLDALGAALDKATADYGENSEEALKAQNAYNRQAKTVNDLTTQLHKAEAELSGMSAAMEDNNDALKQSGGFFQKLAGGARDAADGLNKAGSAGLSFGDIIKANVISEAVIGGIRALGEAMKTVASAALDLAKDSVAGFSQYEQLAGGVKTLFGTEAASLEEYARSVGKSAEEVSGEYEKLLAAQQTVFDNADKAFQTAGLSANEYMETVTSFSASLLQGLGGDTEKAAALADQAIIDMADNANKMGTDIGSIQYAYQGFAKQSYAMLDNLKLGYGGTQEEMVRLINDSGILEKQIENLDGIRFDQIVEAIHEVQTNMGITGTTAQEASSTIEGSTNAMKAAWSNLVSGMARDDADLSGLMSDLVGSVETAGANLLPRITTILSSMGTLVAQLAPEIAGQVPQLVEQVVPPMVEAGAQMLGGVATGLLQALPELLSYAGEALTGLRDSFLELVPSLVQGLQEKTPEFISAGLDLLGGLASSLRENAGLAVDAMIELAKGLAQGIADGIPAIIEKAPQIVSDLANTINDNAPKIFAAAWDIIKTLIKGLIDAIPTLIANIPQIISAIADTITAFNWLNLGKKIIDFFAQGIKGMLSSVANAAKDIIKAITDGGGLKNLPQMALKWGKDMLDNFIKGIKDKIKAVKDAVSNVASTVKSFIGFSEPEKGPLSNFHTYAPDMMKLFAEGIRDNAHLLEAAFNNSLNFGSSAVERVSEVYLQNSSALGEAITGGRAEGMLGGLDTVADAAKATANEAVSAVGQAMASVIKSVGGIEYEPDADYAKLMLAAKNLEEFEELSAKRNAKIIGENLDLIEKGYSDNAQLLAQWQSMQSRAKEQSARTVDALVGTVSDTLRSFLDDTPEMGRQFSEQLAEGIRSGMSAVVSAAADVARAAAETASQVLSIDIPSLQADVAPAMTAGYGGRDGQIVDMLSKAVQAASGSAGSINYAELGRTVYGAVRDGLSGTGVYLEGRRVGKVVSDWQSNENMAMGR